MPVAPCFSIALALSRQLTTRELPWKLLRPTQNWMRNRVPRSLAQAILPEQRFDEGWARSRCRSRGRRFRQRERAHRSEEHTSELQSHLNLVCRLLLEKKKQHPS